MSPRPSRRRRARINSISYDSLVSLNGPSVRTALDTTAARRPGGCPSSGPTQRSAPANRKMLIASRCLPRRTFVPLDPRQHDEFGELRCVGTPRRIGSAGTQPERRWELMPAGWPPYGGPAPLPESLTAQKSQGVWGPASPSSTKLPR